ncbi:conjugal transfer protein TraH [Piscirickettsia salmonis]|uniref:conjugal transfer protein TraH n=1 Tax=Piscirickettsia salmonis TaxID=1238 RepID=UPI0006BCA10F|nr:conjugal transfer protein TraH [Piscirickettsia salmonis]ALA26650.1 conjugal transfer protein TraH [Piscirickettsia salmonis]APS45863.1 conjugal transfer protein TraH [Piscirickettsia salmonis]APS49254.1 conjugal transfer protein TraH [Piscirickettsia salmonis]QGO82359.1 conjugal transfer pilus assembly protein TraH [Piscirickettsia salmonis]QGP24188.1 conjugal transfer pilus assembly protein TraH [Piscirickettsia salmonis]
MFKKIKTIALALSIACSQGYADTNSDLQTFFGGLGFAGHVNNPATYDSQAAGYATFGSIYERNRVRDVQLMHVDVPGFRSGCGGIDLTAGGFSFIKSDQIVKFMQSVLSSGAGYALNLALEIEMPEIAHALQYMQKLAQEINSGNYNSCEMGEDLVGGLWTKSRASQEHVCQDIGTHTGVFSDWAKARQGCSTGSDLDGQLDKAKKDPAYKYRVYKNTNIVWDQVVQKNTFLSSDKELGEMYMSISGTVVFDNNGGISTYASKAVDNNFIKHLLYGGKLPTYTCKDSGSTCINVEYSPNSFQTIAIQNALVNQVKKQLDDIYTHLKDDTDLTDEEKGLISMTQSPVFSVISVDAQEGIGVQGIETLAEMVATDLLAQYLEDALDIIQSSLSGTQLDQGNIQNLFKSIQQAREYVNELDVKSRAKYQQALSINLDVQKMMGQAMSSLSPMLRDALKNQQEV